MSQTLQGTWKAEEKVAKWLRRLHKIASSEDILVEYSGCSHFPSWALEIIATLFAPFPSCGSLEFLVTAENMRCL